MFHITPPSPPLPVPIYSEDNCKKGSRDCFPDNTQGGAIEDMPSKALAIQSRESEPREPRRYHASVII